MSYYVAGPANDDDDDNHNYNNINNRSLGVLPRATTCCFCISLRLGVYLIALFDTAFSFLKVIGCILVLAQPEILQSYVDQTSETGEARSGASEYELGALRANLMLAAGSVVFAFKGALATRTCDAEGLRTYLNWRVLSLVMTMLLAAMLHRVWWSGCGFLSPADCAHFKMELVVGALVSMLPGIFFVWKIWSLWALLEEADDFALYNAGYNDEDLERLRVKAEAARRYGASANANFSNGYREAGSGTGSRQPGRGPATGTTYLV